MPTRTEQTLLNVIKVMIVLAEVDARKITPDEGLDKLEVLRAEINND